MNTIKKPQLLIGLSITFAILICQTAHASEFFKILKDIEVHGFVSSSYSYNANEPANENNCGTGGNCLRIFDVDDNSFKLDVGEFVILKNASETGDIGFRTDLTYGHSVPENSRSTRSDPGTSDDDFDVQQAFVTWNAPLGNGLQLDFGKFSTHVGEEVIEGYDGFNKNYSRSFLFGLGEPFVHHGVRASYAVNDQLSFMGMLANGWGNATDNNDSKTLGFQVAYSPLEKVGILFNWAGGNETASDDDWRNVFNLILNLSLTNELSTTVEFVYGNEENTSLATVDPNTEWWGIATYVRYDFNKWFSLNLRGEFAGDQDGFMTGVAGQKLWEITVTPEFRIHDNMVVRAEYRHDDSNLTTFLDSGTPVGDQDTFAINALIFF